MGVILLASKGSVDDGVVDIFLVNLNNIKYWPVLTLHKTTNFSYNMLPSAKNTIS